MNRVTTTNQASKGLHTIGWIATTLVIIGALNWLLVGLFNVDVVASIFGHMTSVSRIVYVLVGISGLYEIYFDDLTGTPSWMAIDDGNGPGQLLVPAGAKWLSRCRDGGSARS